MQRIRVSKRNMVYESKKSMNLTEAYEHEKMMAEGYRDKSEKSIIKCRFLYSKLSAIGSLDGIPAMMGAEVSELDCKIRDLEESIYFKKSQQMKKLKKKVGCFLEVINFEVHPEDMDQIQDEIEIILFLIDIFQEKFREMTAQRKEVDQVIFRLDEAHD